MERDIQFRFRTIQVAANLTGVVICVTYFVFFDDIRPVVVDSSHYFFAAVLTTLLVFIFGTTLNYSLQKPVLRYVVLRAAGHAPSPETTLKVQRRLLNVPIIAGVVGMLSWSLAAFFIPLVLHWLPSTSAPEEKLLSFLWMFTGIILSGVVTSVLTFFGQEISVRRLHAAFFPQGGVADMSGVFRVSLRSRVLLFFFLGGLLPMMDMAFLVYNKARMALSLNPQVFLEELLALLIYILVVEGVLTLVLAHYLTRSIVEPVQRLQKAMNSVAGGNLSTRAQLNDNNELGHLGDHFNRMTAGLQERYELQRTIGLAREVQQTLLPQQLPRCSGLEIAGKSIYCDATGGDYWDYLIREQEDNGSIDIAIGDVSGHGLPAALFMASVRAGLRQRVALGGDIAKIVTDVNRQFSRDVEGSGNFMTLLYLSVDRSGKCLKWVRAGHDPAMLYDPDKDSFLDLKGEGVALGANEDCLYKSFKHDGLQEGQLILLGTDGIWEARSKTGEMLGKAPVRGLVREQAHRTATEIVDALSALVQDFISPGRLEDDITLVVIKVVAENQNVSLNQTACRNNEKDGK
ncbi:PP2C family protein-serine/threonine phosphatase [Desulfopila aestuarii]|nr:SpoIIE family protein phosphatase [Desulfopila aestuarii]